MTLAFADGSLATIAYTALGDAAFSKERFEMFAGGTVVTIDNYLAMTVTADGRTRTDKARTGQDKGHAAEIAAFIAGVTRGQGAGAGGGAVRDEPRDDRGGGELKGGAEGRGGRVGGARRGRREPDRTSPHLEFLQPRPRRPLRRR